MSRNSVWVDDTIKKAGRRYVIFEDDFSTGNQGWNGLLDSGDNYYPVLDPHSLTGPYSLRLDTFNTALTSVSAIACKRFWAFSGIWHVLFRFAWSGDDENDLRYLRWVLDWQHETDTRRWIELDYTHWNTSTEAMLARWRVSDGNVNNMQEITAVSGKRDALSGYELGFNAGGASSARNLKPDFHEVEFSVAVKDNDYHWREVRVDNKRFDISDLSLNGSQTAENDFANGSNVLMYVVNRDDEASHPWALLDYVRVEVEPEA